MPGRILIVDDVVTNRIILRASLASAALEVDQSFNAATALSAARARMPDLVIVSASLQEANAFSLCRNLRALPRAAALPVMMIGDTAHRATRLAALEAGIDAFLDRRSTDDCVLAWVRNLLRRAALESEQLRNEGSAGQFGFAESLQQGYSNPCQIALIAPSVRVGMQWRNALRPLLRDQIEVLNPACVLSELNCKRQPDAIVIAADAGRTGGALRLLSDLRCRNESHRAAIVLLQDKCNPDLGVMAPDLGVNDLVETGFDATEMALRLRRELARKSRADRCRAAMRDGLRLAATDPLTGLFNRRYAMSELERIIAGTGRSHGEFAVMMLDLDRFKRINDLLGHAAGDAVLTEVSRRMSACLRGGDFLARIGGEEFLAVIRNCDAPVAAKAAERLRKVVSATPIEVGDGKAAVQVTLSIGLVLSGRNECDEPNSPARLVDLADRALYVAKADGHNQVTVHKTAA